VNINVVEELEQGLGTRNQSLKDTKNSIQVTRASQLKEKLGLVLRRT